MSYIVTARKWRPQQFHDVLAQSHVTETLQNAITGGRVGHAYLFSGPRGVGKTTVARIFAKALNCISGPSVEPCNVCENCVSIQTGASMDVQELDGASNNSVDDVRNLIAGVGYHSAHSRYKMYIIDEVHMLSLPAFNALLKTLEEPPPNVIFVFATTEPHKIPETILSRCQRFDFHRLSVQDIAEKLRTIVHAEGMKIDDPSITLIARRANGAMRDAESILEQIKSSHEEMITVDEVNKVLGIADRDVFFRILDCSKTGDVAGSLEIFSRYYDEGGDLKEFVEGLLSHLRDLLYAQYPGGIEHILLSDDMKVKVQGQAKLFERGDLIRMIGFLMDAETSLAYSVIPVLRIEVALARIATMETTVQLKDLFDKITRGTPRDEEQPPQVKKTESHREILSVDNHSQMIDHIAETNDESSVVTNIPPMVEETEHREKVLHIEPVIESIRDGWGEIIARIEILKPALGPSLAKAVPVSYQEGILTLGFKPEHTFQMKTIESSLERVSEILSDIMGLEVTVACYENRQTTFVFQETARDKKKSETDDLITHEPVIKDILEQFNGEINDSWRE